MKYSLLLKSPDKVIEEFVEALNPKSAAVILYHKLGFDKTREFTLQQVEYGINEVEQFECKECRFVWDTSFESSAEYYNGDVCPKCFVFQHRIDEYDQIHEQ